MEHLQNEVGTKYVFRGTNVLTRNALDFPRNVCAFCFVGPKNSRQTSLQKSKKITDELLQDRIWGSLGEIVGSLALPAMLQKDSSRDSGDIRSMRNTLSTAGNSMTSSERPSPEPLLKKSADRKSGPAERGQNRRKGGHVKKRQKKNRQQVSRQILTLYGNSHAGQKLAGT